MQQEKKKKTKRDIITKGPETAFMPKIEEEKRVIPCEKDSSVIFARLDSGMKWWETI